MPKICQKCLPSNNNHEHYSTSRDDQFAYQIQVCATVMAPNTPTQRERALRTIKLRIIAKTDSLSSLCTSLKSLRIVTRKQVQSSNTLLTIAQELRNTIFEYVFCDNIDKVYEQVVEQIRNDPGNDKTHAVFTIRVPARIRLDKASPPSKIPLLVCRQLYTEMRQMYRAAYRAYWHSNRFLCSPADQRQRALRRRTSRPRTLPQPLDLWHISHFTFPLHGIYYMEVAWGGRRWTVRLVSACGETPADHALDAWDLAQEWFEGWIRRSIDPRLDCEVRMGDERYAPNPYFGQGLDTAALDRIGQMCNDESMKTHLLGLARYPPANGI